jgi:hypothetical protein
MKELEQMTMTGLADLQPKIRTSDSLGEKYFHGNRRLTVREVAEEVGISFGSCHTILTEDLGLHRVPRVFDFAPEGQAI